MTARPPTTGDFVVDGVVCPGRICRLVAPTLARNVRAAYAAYGKVDDELVAWVSAVELAGARYAARANASSPDVGSRESFADASDPDGQSPRSAQCNYDLLTTADAATTLGITPAGVRDAAKHGRLSAARCKPYLFDPAEVARFATTRRKSA
jgi:hypothetical protein